MKKHPKPIIHHVPVQGQTVEIKFTQDMEYPKALFFNLAVNGVPAGWVNLEGGGFHTEE